MATQKQRSIRGFLASTACALMIAAACPGLVHADVVGVRIGTDGGGSSVPINSSSVIWGTRFTANETTTVNEALAKLTSYTGSPNFVVAVQADDGFGNPNGVDLGVATMGSGSGFTTGSFGTPVSLVQGNVYHFLHRVSNADGSNNIAVASSAPGIVLTHADDGTPEDNYALTFSSNGGSTWSTFSDKLMWGLRSTVTGDALGQPYDGQTFQNVGGTSWQGQSFTLTGFGGNTQLNAVSMKVFKGSASVADDLRAYLIDTTTGLSVWDDVLMDKNAAVTGGTGDEVFASVPSLVLVDGRKYILAVESENSSAGAYQLFIPSTQAPTPWLEALNFQEAENSQYLAATSTGLPTTFTALDNATARFDAFFSLDLNPVPEPASLVLLIGGVTLMLTRRKQAR